MALIEEMKRRNVFKAAALYLVTAWLILQVADLLLEALALPPQWMRLIIVLLVLGFPLVMIFSWVYEITPEGVKREKEVAPGESITALTGRRINLMILVLLLISILLYFVRPFDSVPGQQPESAVSTGLPAASNSVEAAKVPDTSIAVLPFADMSENKDQEYFADGMAEEILNVLARVDGLRVASRTSSFAFKLQPEQGAPAIARELGVRHILEGSVRKAGDTVRITIQLVDTDKDQHLWSDTFDRPLTTDNLFAIQDEVAGAVVAVLRAKLGAQLGDAAPAPARTDDVDAYSLFLEARALFQARRDLDEADRLLEKALKLDPEFADALAIRAAIYEFGGNYGADFGDYVDTRTRGRAFARKALDLDPENSLALGISGLYELRDHRMGMDAAPYTAIKATLEHALTVDPTNSNVLHWMGLFYLAIGDNQRAAHIHRRCVELDPTLSVCNTALTAELLVLGHREEAGMIMDTAANRGTFALSPQSLVLLAELRRREVFRYLAPYLHALRGWRDFDALYEAMIDSTADDRDIESRLKTLLEKNNSTTPDNYILLNALGGYEYPLIVPAIQWIGVFHSYRQSPEFKQHMRTSGVVDYWREYGFPPQCRPIGKNDFECD